MQGAALELDPNASKRDPTPGRPSGRAKKHLEPHETGGDDGGTTVASGLRKSSDHRMKSEKKCKTENQKQCMKINEDYGSDEKMKTRERKEGARPSGVCGATQPLGRGDDEENRTEDMTTKTQDGYRGARPSSGCGAAQPLMTKKNGKNEDDQKTKTQDGYGGARPSSGCGAAQPLMTKKNEEDQKTKTQDGYGGARPSSGCGATQPLMTRKNEVKKKEDDKIEAEMKIQDGYDGARPSSGCGAAQPHPDRRKDENQKQRTLEEVDEPEARLRREAERDPRGSAMSVEDAGRDLPEQADPGATGSRESRSMGRISDLEEGQWEQPRKKAKSSPTRQARAKEAEETRVQVQPTIHGGRPRRNSIDPHGGGSLAKGNRRETLPALRAGY